MPSRTDSWSVRGLKERCELLQTDLEARRLATAEELAAYWPGGKNNTAEPGRGQWIFCYANFVRFRGRSEHREAAASGAEGVALAILAIEPEVIATSGLPLGAPGPLAVHQKSLWALGHLAAHDTVLAQLQAGVAALRGSREPADVKLVAQAQARIAEELTLCVWAALHPGPLLPWDPNGPLPEAPDWVRSLDGYVVLRIQRAYQRVNGTNLAAIRVLLAPDPDAGGGDTPLTLFAGILSGTKADLGFTPERMIRERPLLQFLAQIQLRASAVREAYAAAEVKAERKAARERR
jgi:hypothetical protein